VSWDLLYSFYSDSPGERRTIGSSQAGPFEVFHMGPGSLITIEGGWPGPSSALRAAGVRVPSWQGA
jgi:hypothetical protein